MAANSTCTAKLMVCVTSLTTRRQRRRPVLRPYWQGETQINDMLTGYGQWEYNDQGEHHRRRRCKLTDSSGLCRSEIRQYGSSIMAVTMVLSTTLKRTDALPNSAVILIPEPMSICCGQGNGVATYRQYRLLRSGGRPQASRCDTG